MDPMHVKAKRMISKMAQHQANLPILSELLYVQELFKKSEEKAYHKGPEFINNVQVSGLEQAIKASKYPMSIEPALCSDDITPTVIKLGQAPRDSGHDNFLKGINVQFDVTFTIKAWTEAERYHWFDIVSSQSTMHRLTRFNLNTAYIEYVDLRMIEIMKELVATYNANPTKENYLKVLYSNPVGCKLTARITTNYQQLKTIYFQRRDHRLPEWVAFCRWIETLPLFRTLILGEEKQDV